MRRKCITLGAVAGALVLVSAAPVMGARLASTSGSQTSVCFEPASGFESSALGQMKTAADEWNGVSTALDVSFDNCSKSSDHVIPIKVGDSSQIEVVNELGQTDGYTDGTLLTGIEITFIVDAIDTWGKNTGTVAAAWRSTACHEMGHALGLEHSKSSKSCMWTGTLTPTGNTLPDAEDKRTIRSLYGGEAKPASDEPEDADQATESAQESGESSTTGDAQSPTDEDSGDDPDTDTGVSSDTESDTKSESDTVESPTTEDTGKILRRHTPPAMAALLTKAN